MRNNITIFGPEEDVNMPFLLNLFILDHLDVTIALLTQNDVTIFGHKGGC